MSSELCLGVEERGDARRAPVLFDEVFILRDSRNARKGSPVGRLLVVERDVDVVIIGKLLELVRLVVRDEDEGELGFGRSCIVRFSEQNGISIYPVTDDEVTHESKASWLSNA